MIFTRRAVSFATLLMLALGTCVSVAAQAQKPQKAEKEEKGEQEQAVARKDVPAPVLAAFQKAYPKANIIGFSKEVDERKTVYEVESTEGKTHRDVTYTGDGKMVSLEESMDINEMPAAVKQAVDKKFPGGKITKSEKVTKGAVVAYEFEIEYKGKTVEIVFDAQGKETKI